MLRTTLAAALLLTGSSAFAAERAPSPPCKPLAKFKAEFDQKTHLKALTTGQFLFAAGLYVANPTTPEGMPPGDGALLATHDGARNGILIWTRGTLACAPIPIDEKLMKLIIGVKGGALGDDGESL